MGQERAEWGMGQKRAEWGKVGACYFLDIFNKWAGSAIGNDSTATGAIRAVDGCPPSLIPCLKCMLSYHSCFLSLLI